MCALLSTGCQKDNPATLIDFDTFTAGNGKWEAGDAVGLFAVEHGDSFSESGNYLNNIKLVYDGSKWTSETEIQWPGNGSALDFRAYSPYSEEAVNPMSISFSGSDLSTVSCRTATADNIAFGETVSLEFSESLLATVELSVPKTLTGAGPGENLTVFLQNVREDMVLNLAEGTTTASGDPVTVEMTRVEQPEDSNYGTSYTYRAQIPAQELEAGLSILRYNHEGWKEIQDAPLQEAVVLEGGQTTGLQRTLDSLIHTIPIQAGDFIMGFEESETYYIRPHKVTLTRSFRMAQYEVTCGQYVQFLNSMNIGEEEIWGYETHGYGKQSLFQLGNPFEWNGSEWVVPEGSENIPVTYVNFYGANEFALWIGGQLPTEAQWEYACRAGTTTSYSFGDDNSMLSDYAWWSGNSDGVPHEVGQKLPNPWNLYDMHGNVSELTSDFWSEEYSDEDGLIDPAYPGEPGQTIGYRLLKGGSFFGDIDLPNGLDCCSGAQMATFPGGGYPQIGFRIIYYTD